LRFIDADLATVQRESIELGDCVGRPLSIAHGHERKASRLPGSPVHRDGYFAHFPGNGESRFEGGLGGFERQIAYEETVSHGCLSDFTTLVRAHL
jgi:hypothetical protein